MQRHEPGFRPHADERGDGDRDLRARPRLDRAPAAERTRVGEQQHRDPGAGAHEVRERDVDVHRAPGLPVVAPDEDDRGRDERHQLPGGEERQRVTGAQHEREDEQEDARERGRDARPVASLREIARGEDERRRSDEPEHEEEVAARRIDAEPRLELTREGRAELVPGHERSETGEPDDERSRAPGPRDPDGRSWARRRGRSRLPPRRAPRREASQS